MGKYIMALDAGTTSNRCIIFDRLGNIVSVAQREFNQIYPKPGWVEHDPDEIWSTMMGVMVEAMAKIGITPKEVSGIGITNQRETTVLWDAKTGKSVYNAIVWQCRRTAEMSDFLIKQGYDDLIFKKTGLRIDPYFSATKIKWIMENVSGVKEKIEKGEILFGTIDTYLIWRLTGGNVHVTDYSNASRTMLFNINTLEWDEEILGIMGIPTSILPEVKESSCIYGYADSKLFGGESIPIGGAAGDQQCALFGQNCMEKGSAKTTYGTGCFLLMNTGEKPVYSKNGLVSTIAWGIDGKITYALEGSIFMGGAVVQWLRDELKLINSASETAQAALSVEDSNGCYIVPAFTGLGAPYWDSYARGTITNLTRGVNRNHIIRAALEGIAYQVNDVIKVMEKDSNVRNDVIKVDGGASANDFLMQFQSDITGAYVYRPSCIETTALGAAFLAGLAVGFWEDIHELTQIQKIDKLFKPNMNDKNRKESLDGWKKAVERARL